MYFWAAIVCTFILPQTPLSLHNSGMQGECSGYSLNLHATWYSQFDHDYSLSKVGAYGCDAFTLD